MLDVVPTGPVSLLSAAWSCSPWGIQGDARLGGNAARDETARGRIYPAAPHSAVTRIAADTLPQLNKFKKDLAGFMILSRVVLIIVTGTIGPARGTTDHQECTSCLKTGTLIHHPV